MVSDPGSFRDPSSRVIIDGARVLRLLDERGVEAWEALASSDFFGRAVAAGELIDAAPLDGRRHGAAGALEHPRLPLVTYPYEWTFSMLKDAALLHLRLLEEALAEGLTIKDGTPFNIQFRQGAPVFIDIGSLEPYREGDPWMGYRQFSRQFLFPLMMRSWAGVPFQPWLRGRLDGPTPSEMRRLLPPLRRLMPGALTNVSLQARLESRSAGRPVRRDLQRAGFGKDLILANLRRLGKLVASLGWEPSPQGWAGYHTCDHVARDRQAKAEFLRQVLARRSPARVLDLGANDGHFSQIAGDRGALAMAVDADEPVLDELYSRSRGSEVAVVLSDIADPSPSQGWAGTERPGLWARARPDLVIAYGVVHHLVYTSSIPPRAVTEWLRGFDSVVALEYVAPEDEMVDRLTANKRADELHPNRGEQEFRAVLSDLFDVGAEQRLETPTRVLYELLPR